MMFEEDLNDMDYLDQGDWNYFEGGIGMEGEPRSTLITLNNCRDKYNKVVEKITFLKSLVDRGKVTIIDYKKKILMRSLSNV